MCGELETLDANNRVSAGTRVGARVACGDRLYKQCVLRLKRRREQRRIDWDMQMLRRVLFIRQHVVSTLSNGLRSPGGNVRQCHTHNTFYEACAHCNIHTRNVNATGAELNGKWWRRAAGIIDSRERVRCKESTIRRQNAPPLSRARRRGFPRALLAEKQPQLEATQRIILYTPPFVARLNSLVNLRQLDANRSVPFWRLSTIRLKSQTGTSSGGFISHTQRRLSFDYTRSDPIHFDGHIL